MAVSDYFADIAMTAHPVNVADKEIVPVEIEKRLVSPVEGNDSADDVVFDADLTDEERLAGFKSELEQLRKRYKPFLNQNLKEIEDEKIDISKFDFRYMDRGEVFSNIADADSWEKITIPDYRGPIGKWKGCYKSSFSARPLKNGERAVIEFQSVDYKAEVFINGSFVGQHEGFFSPFSFDISDYLREDNELIIIIENDYSILGEGDVDGDKIYAATGLGWDDPNTGWHHCPAGAGIFGKVDIAYVSSVRVEDIFVRPNIDKDYIELRLGITNYNNDMLEGFGLRVSILAQNFDDDYHVDYETEVPWIGIAKNEYRHQIPMEKGYRLWNCESPYLYAIKTVLLKDGNEISTKCSHFGMRKFVSDETTAPKGKFFLNNKPLLLRGANEMGHLPQCVLNDDYDQLIDDILIAKLCNMNYYRLTQRPVQKEIYDYMDMLGMMTQTDLPLFSFLRRPQFAEAIRQTQEMEHLIRNHPSAIMVTFINEPVCIRRTEDPNSKFSKRYDKKGHRELLRDELEAFFEAARKTIYVENPDRVIKNVEGDYDPPTLSGMPDFHCYTMWYSNHAVPIGKLMRGYLPAVKAGWMVGCGEYGAEGLDNENIMRDRYPKEWMETDSEDHWYPTKIVRAQTNGVQGDWYKEQNTVKDWVRESQIHQEKATRLMTDAFRRRSDILSHTAIHLLIDAWPSGWMKTLLGVDRIPKKAYYAYKQSLTPIRLSIKSDRLYYHSGEKAEPEIWLLNDTDFTGEVVIGSRLSMNENIISEYKFKAEMPQATARYEASLDIDVPEVDSVTVMRIDSWIRDLEGSVIYSETKNLYAYPDLGKKATKKEVRLDGKLADKVAEILKLSNNSHAETLLISNHEGKDNLIEKELRSGNDVIVLADCNKELNLNIDGHSIATVKGPKLFFNVADEKYHLEFLYNEDKDYIDFQNGKVITSDVKGEELAYTYGKKAEDGKSPAPKVHLPVAEKIKLLNANLYVLSFYFIGRVGVNANLDELICDCITGRI